MSLFSLRFSAVLNRKATIRLEDKLTDFFLKLNLLNTFPLIIISVTLEFIRRFKRNRRDKNVGLVTIKKRQVNFWGHVMRKIVQEHLLFPRRIKDNESKEYHTCNT